VAGHLHATRYPADERTVVAAEVLGEDQRNVPGAAEAAVGEPELTGLTVLCVYPGLVMAVSLT
jgi:hypothetical protein